MRILLAVDGSKFTKKALAFLVTHEALAGPDAELVVLNVQPAVPPRVRAMLGSDAVRAWNREEAEKVLLPIERFLKRHHIAFRTSWTAGNAAAQIVQATQREKVHMLVMGTHGHGLLGRALLGSVAQRVVADVDVPVLLVQ